VASSASLLSVLETVFKISILIFLASSSNSSALLFKLLAKSVFPLASASLAAFLASLESLRALTARCLSFTSSALKCINNI